MFQGRAWLNKGLTPDYMSRAQSYFEKAVELDSRNVEALVGLAHVHWSLAAIMTDEWSAHFMAEATISRAVSLAPNMLRLLHTRAVLVLHETGRSRNRRGRARADTRPKPGRAHALIGYAKYLLGRGAETGGALTRSLSAVALDTFAPALVVLDRRPRLQCKPMKKQRSGSALKPWGEPGLFGPVLPDLAAVFSRLGKSG